MLLAPKHKLRGKSHFQPFNCGRKKQGKSYFGQNIFGMQKRLNIDYQN